MIIPLGFVDEGFAGTTDKKAAMSIFNWEKMDFYLLEANHLTTWRLKN